MMTTLLASCDPVGTIKAGGSALDYAPLASRVAARLGREGCRRSDIMALFPDRTNAALALQFTDAAFDWWTRSVLASTR